MAQPNQQKSAHGVRKKQGGEKILERRGGGAVETGSQERRAGLRNSDWKGKNMIATTKALRLRKKGNW